MNYIVLYHQAVKKDISEAKNWYQSRRKGLEKRFASEVKSSIIHLSEDPYLFEKRYKDVRIIFTRVFPFGVHFHLNESTKTITILGVFHTSLSPDKWTKRIEKTNP